ncbi:MAG: hypothetical protein ACYDEF_01760 [Methanosarcina sp.]
MTQEEFQAKKKEILGI